VKKSGRGIFLLLPAAFVLFQCSSPSEEVYPIPEAVFSLTDIPDGPDEEININPEDPEVILEALHMAYPGKIQLPEVRDGDWSILVNNVIFYWAGGRLLPAEERMNTEQFIPYQFRPNPEEIPPVRDLSPEEKKQLEMFLERKERHEDVRYDGFMTALWGMEDFITAENTVIRAEFLGHNIRIHPDIFDVLMNVEARILEAAQNDEDTALWLDELNTAGAYVWRDIAGSGNRSLHSWGIAVDLTPGDYRGKQAYWRWAADYNDEWWSIPYDRRYRIPDAVVAAFEDNGFIWGGKWLLFDQIHFEYRPELILLGKLLTDNQ
jgi:hypothetical protein